MWPKLINRLSPLKDLTRMLGIGIINVWKRETFQLANTSKTLF